MTCPLNSTVWISNCLLDIFTGMYNRHLRLDMFKFRLPKHASYTVSYPSKGHLNPSLFSDHNTWVSSLTSFFFFSFSFLFHSLLENTDSSMFYIKLNTYFCISIWKNLFITKWFSYHLPGPISSSFLTWIITVASESTTFIHNPLMSIFIISPRWIFSKLKLHHIPCCSKLPCHITC